jgi:ABC-type transport system involved in multi-copper enzyme maturation permease subunit
MLTQTIAIFHDAYRELNAKRMFWIVLVLSGLVVLGFALVGVSNDHLTLAGKELGLPIMLAPADFYRVLFVGLGIGYWLTFFATILAIISTASIFPDFVSGGSVDLYLSKPISRLRLFVTKYVAGLLFVALQVLVFSVASFLVLGVRGGTWEPRVLLAVPIVVCFFSYLYCVSVLVGVTTRSTIAAILLTVLAWGFMFLLSSAEVGLLYFQKQVAQEARSSVNTLKLVNGQIAYDEKQSPENRMSADQRRSLQQQRSELEAQVNSKAAHNLEIAHSIVYGVKTAAPKTSETIGLLNRWLLSPDALRPASQRALDDEDEAAPPKPTTRGKGLFDRASDRAERRRARAENAAELQEELNERPVWWVVGTSLGFECVVLALAAWVFCRRDY